ncbi:hypothetical protein ACF1DW_28905 [Streptomyces sp. NPDC014603]|uniref:hypothetical protein n=1 Tax=unclassified Streptomyces TaxID=2593676 RepID=UPI003674D24E
MSDGQGMHDHDRPSGGDRPAEDPARPDGSAPGTEPERENGGSLSDPSDSSDLSDSSDPSDSSGSGSPVEPASPRSGEPVSVEGSVSVGGPGIVGGSADDEGAASAEGAAGSGDPGSAGELGADERALRDLLHRAVREVEPSDGTLDYLRRAVPARRARKRQALVGMAAAALFVGTAVPAVVHVSTSSGSDANPSAVGHASQAQGGTSQGKGPDNGASTAGGSSDEIEGTGKGGEKGKDEGTGDSTGAGATEGTGPSSSADTGAPACTADHLGAAVASTAAPDSTGTVYGAFRVTNGSGDACTVGAPGAISVATQGAADPAKVGTMRHAPGDAAAGLPDPSLEAASGLLLKPGAAYEVKFAWVPSETCPTTGGGTGGGTGGPSPDPTPSGGTTTTGATTGGGGDGGASPQTLRGDGTVEGSVTVTYTAATGTGAASATVANACAGTVYWTGVLTAS